MKKNLIGAFLAFSVVILISLVAAPHLSAKDGKPDRAGRPSVSIPEHALEVVPDKVYWLGTAVEDGRLVEGYAIIHRKKGFGKPNRCNNDGICQRWEKSTCGDCAGSGGDDPDTSSCYGFLAKGAKWKNIEDYMVDPDNLTGLGSDFISANLAEDIDRWEDAADGAVSDGYILDIIGNEISGTVDGADMSSPDGKNEVYFANVDSQGAIAITVVWGIFSGPPARRELVEWDQVYDDVDFGWSEDCVNNDCTGKMDFENIAVHELGHSFGLADLYTGECSEQSMYGYAAGGETKKRDLEDGDMKGISSMYK